MQPTSSSTLMRGVVAAQAVALALAAGALTGCKSYSPSRYVSPRVTGQVLNARTREPIAEVEVRRVDPDQHARNFTPQHGGELMVQNSGVRSGPDGTFVLPSVRDLSPFGRLNWYSVDLSFERVGYERFVTNYSRANAITTPEGEPVIAAGDILLQPRSP